MGAGSRHYDKIGVNSRDPCRPVKETLAPCASAPLAASRSRGQSRQRRRPGWCRSVTSVLLLALPRFPVDIERGQYKGRRDSKLEYLRNVHDQLVHDEISQHVRREEESDTTICRGNLVQHGPLSLTFRQGQGYEQHTAEQVEHRVEDVVEVAEERIQEALGWNSEQVREVQRVNIELLLSIDLPHHVGRCEPEHVLSPADLLAKQEDHQERHCKEPAGGHGNRSCPERTKEESNIENDRRDPQHRPADGG